MALSGNSVATFVPRPAAIGVTKILVIVFVKRVSGESSVISHVLTCVRTINVILNQETVLNVILEGMENYAKTYAHRVVTNLAA